MHSAYNTIAAVARTLPFRLSGHRIEEVYSQDRDEMVIAFEGVTERLVVSCRPGFHCCYLHGAFARAKKNSANVLSGAIGRTVAGAVIHSSDRVLSILLDDGNRMVMQFFGARSNVLLTSDRGVILDAFKRARELTGQTLIPSPAGVLLSPEGMTTVIRQLHLSTVAQAIKKCAPQYPSVIVREVLHRAGIAPETSVAALSCEQHDQLRASLGSVAGDLEKPLSRIYTNGPDEPAQFSIIPLSMYAAYKEECYEDIHEALRSFAAAQRTIGTVLEQRRGIERRIHSAYDHARRTVDAIEKDLAAGDRAEQYMRYGTLILQHLPSIRPGSPRAEVAAEEGAVTIPLAPNLTPSQNAQRYFEKAKAGKNSRVQAERRRATYNARMERYVALLDELKGLTTRQELKDYMERHHKDIHGHDADIPSDDQDQPLFKTFTVEGGFEVWAGKSSENNDLLTLRYAKPQDFWFHARGVPGSHVILRVSTGRSEPGKRALQQAASIAAYYSKMRTAKMVPVAVTRRKYVHKPKGARAGSVVLQREDVLMVEPELPQRSEDSDE
jgi:predicted ribosome quality control (RQC) complex YloA/Tae2 family protein